MVRSIRHWCLATQMLEEGKSRLLSASDVARAIFNEFDPYLEDIGTLWIIHWRLASNKEKATTWYLAFSGWNQPEFTKDELALFVSERLEDNSITHVAESSIRRDVDCFIRTYVPARTTHTLLLEDTLDCPLTELQLISELADRKTYRFNRGNHPTLPDELLAYMIADYWNQPAYEERETLSFEDVMYRPGSPGRLLRLDEGAMVSRLERMDEATQDAFHFSASTGLRQLYRVDRGVKPMDILRRYYDTKKKG